MWPLADMSKFTVYDKRIDIDHLTNQEPPLIKVNKPGTRFYDFSPCWINLRYFEKQK